MSRIQSRHPLLCMSGYKNSVLGLPASPKLFFRHAPLVEINKGYPFGLNQTISMINDIISAIGTASHTPISPIRDGRV